MAPHPAVAVVPTVATAAVAAMAAEAMAAAVTIVATRPAVVAIVEATAAVVAATLPIEPPVVHCPSLRIGSKLRTSFANGADPKIAIFAIGRTTGRRSCHS